MKGLFGFRIWIGTYNINSIRQCLTKKWLSPWILESGEEPDMFVIGFQELVKLSGKEVAKDLAEFDDGSTKIYAETQLDITFNGEDQTEKNYEQVNHF